MRIICMAICAFCSTFLQGQNISNLLEKDPIHLRGSLSISAIANSFSASDSSIINRRKPPFTYVLSGNPTLSIYGVDLPLSFLFSNYQRSFRQPFNKFGISPTYKSIKFHLGHRNIRFSPYTLNGHTFLGAGVELNPGILRISAVYGRFLKAIEEDTSFVVREDLTRAPRPSFKRNAYALKLGIGSKKTHLDFIYLKGKDIEGSIQSISSENRITPAENAVIGISGRIGFTEALSLAVDIGGSAYTRDLRQDTVELAQNGINNFLSNLLQPRLTSQGFLAGETKLEYKTAHFSIAGKYKRIDPGFRTMGAYYFQTDLAQYLFSLGFSNKKNTLRFNSQFGIQQDNIRDHKLNQTNRTIGSFSLSTQPSKVFGMDVQYSNFGVAQKPGLVSISDTTRLRNVNQNLVVTPRLIIQNAKLTHVVSLIGSWSVLNDKNDFTKDFTEVSSLSTNINYSITHIASGLSAIAGWNRISSKIPAGISQAQGFTFGLSKSFLENKLQLRANYIRNNNSFDELSNGFTSRVTAGCQYAPSRTNRLRLDIYLLKNESQNILASRSFTENTIRLTYTFLFDSTKKK